MEIKYRIVETYPNEHQVLVRFFTDTMPESSLVSSWMPDGKTPKTYRTDYLITLPIPTPSNLEQVIRPYCPVAWFELQAKIADPGIDTSMAGIPKGTVNTLMTL